MLAAGSYERYFPELQESPAAARGGARKTYTEAVALPANFKPLPR